MSNALGCDVSEWQGSLAGTAIDWPAVHASGQIDFVIVRATYGAAHVDADFTRNWHGAVGLHRGAYHFAVPGAATAADAQQQAAFFVAQIRAAGNLQPGDLRPFLDIETTNGLTVAAIQAWAQAFCEAVDSALGAGVQACGLYTGAAFWATYLASSPALATRFRWIAAYQPQPPAVAWSIWQYSSGGHLPGIGPAVDLNQWNGTAASLPPFPVSDPTPGYWLAGKDGGVFSFGEAPFCGSLPQLGISVANIVGVAPTPDRQGYWLVGADGGVFAFGTAAFHGSLPGQGVHVANIVGLVPTASGGGYWLVGADGGVFAFGDAVYAGSLPADGIHVTNIVGLAAR